MDLARWTREICESDFLQHSVSFTVSQLRKEADLEVLLQSMLLLDSRHEGYDNWKGISTAEVTKYCSHIRATAYNDDKRLMVMELTEYLTNAFPEKHKFLKKSNIPMVVVLSKLAVENEIAPDCFKAFIDSFSNAVCPEYEANTGSGNIKRAKTEGRLTAIANAFEEYFHLANTNILGVCGSAYVPMDAENSKTDNEDSSSEAVTPVEGENNGE
jgi:hypothetical protein